MSKAFTFIRVKPNLLVGERYLPLLQATSFLSKLDSWEELENHFELTFSHKKAYREVRAFKINDSVIYLKKYSKHLREAFCEWKNLSLLWEKGFPTSVPLLFYYHSSQAIIGTEKLKGISFVDIIEKKSPCLPNLVKKIAEFLATFHKEQFIHQDCYLNHFYWEEESDRLYLIDVSRVKYKPFLFWYYQIKDLSQLNFSFYKYFGRDCQKWWTLFLDTYQQVYKPLSRLQTYLIQIKFERIKKHTEKLERKRGRKNISHTLILPFLK